MGTAGELPDGSSGSPGSSTRSVWCTTLGTLEPEVRMTVVLNKLPLKLRLDKALCLGIIFQPHLTLRKLPWKPNHDPPNPKVRETSRVEKENIKNNGPSRGVNLTRRVKLPLCLRAEEMVEKSMQGAE